MWLCQSILFQHQLQKENGDHTFRLSGTAYITSSLLYNKVTGTNASALLRNFTYNQSIKRTIIFFRRRDRYEKMEKNPDIMQKFTDALQKGMDYVQSHTPEEIAEVIEPQFPETDLDTITTIVKRYYDQDTWKENLVFEKESFELLQDILQEAGELNERVEYKKLVNTEYVKEAFTD